MKIIKIKKIKINTQHFEATIDVQARTAAIFGDFRTDNVYQIPDVSCCGNGATMLQELIDELCQLEYEARKIISDVRGDDVYA